MKLSEKREIVVRALLAQAGNLVEFHSEYFADHPEVDQEFVRNSLNSWLQRLPGSLWDLRLNKPIDYSDIPG